MPVKLGELLLKENMVTPQQLQEALTHQKMSGGKLGKAFVSLGYVRDEAKIVAGQTLQSFTDSERGAVVELFVSGIRIAFTLVKTAVIA